MKSLSRHLVGGAAFALLLCGAPAVGHADTIIFDDFNDPSLNSSLWLPFVARGSGSVSQVGGRLEVSVRGSELGAAAVAALLGTITGDFEISVGYTLTSLFNASTNETGAGITLSTPAHPIPNGFTVARDTVHDGSLCSPSTYCNGYVGAFPDTAGFGSDEFKAVTADLQGRLRFTRVDSYMAAWYGTPRGRTGSLSTGRVPSHRSRSRVSTSPCPRSARRTSAWPSTTSNWWRTSSHPSPNPPRCCCSAPG